MAMFDDLEDLLDYTSLNSKPTLGKDKTKVIEKSNDEFSIDDLLSMTMDEDVGKDEAERKHSSSTCDVITPSKNQNLVLGGADADVGNNGSCLMKVATKSISCVQCDMVVNRWQGKSWKPEADYIFFRNNAPDRSKMEVMLRREEG